MADFSALKTAIQTYIKQNGNEEITGEILQEILLSVVTTLGDTAINNLVTALADEVAARQNADVTLQQNITNEATARGNADTALQGLINGVKNNVDNGYVYAGIATPSSTPATGKVFYLALTAGTYTNFGSTVVSQGINILKYNGSAWSFDAFIGIDDTPTPNSPKLVKSGGTFDSIMTDGSAFDISAHFASGGTLATYADLSAALTALNTLSASYKKGGMSIKFVQSSDNKYVQARLMAQAFSTTVSDWQGVDEEPTVNSSNVVESKGVVASFYYDSIINIYKIIQVGLASNGVANPHFSICKLYVKNGDVLYLLKDEKTSGIEFRKPEDNTLVSYDSFDLASYKKFAFNYTGEVIVQFYSINYEYVKDDFLNLFAYRNTIPFTTDKFINLSQFFESRPIIVNEETNIDLSSLSNALLTQSGGVTAFGDGTYKVTDYIGGDNLTSVKILTNCINPDFSGAVYCNLQLFDKYKNLLGCYIIDSKLPCITVPKDCYIRLSLKVNSASYLATTTNWNYDSTIRDYGNVNLYNQAEISKRIDENNNIVVANAHYFISEIPVKKGDIIIWPHDIRQGGDGALMVTDNKSKERLTLSTVTKDNLLFLSCTASSTGKIIITGYHNTEYTKDFFKDAYIINTSCYYPFDWYLNDKENFVKEKIGVNLLNPEKCITGWISEDGVIHSPHGGFSVTDFIPVYGNTGKIVMCSDPNLAFYCNVYDSDKTILRTIDMTSLPYTIQNGDYYVRMTLQRPNSSVTVDQFMVYISESAVKNPIKVNYSPVGGYYDEKIEAKKILLWLGSSITEGGTYPINASNKLGCLGINKALGASGIAIYNDNNPYNTIADYVSHIGWPPFRKLSETIAEKTTRGSVYPDWETYRDTILSYSYENRLMPYINGTNTNQADFIIFDIGINDGAVIQNNMYQVLLTKYPSISSINDVTKEMIDSLSVDDFNWESRDRSTFIGAYGYLLDKIWEQDPFKYVIQTSYLENNTLGYGTTDGRNGHGGAWICKMQELCAEHYQIPFVRVYEQTHMTMDWAIGSGQYAQEMHELYGTNYLMQTNNDGDYTFFGLMNPDTIHPQSDLSGRTPKMLDTIFANELKKYIIEVV